MLAWAHVKRAINGRLWEVAQMVVKSKGPKNVALGFLRSHIFLTNANWNTPDPQKKHLEHFRVWKSHPSSGWGSDRWIRQVAVAILSTSTCGSDVISYNAVGWGQWGQWKCRVAVCGLQARQSILKELDVLPGSGIYDCRIVNAKSSSCMFLRMVFPTGKAGGAWIL